MTGPAALAGLGFAMAAASFAAGGWPGGLFGAGLALLTLAIAVVDARRLIIPNGLNLAALALALAAAGLAGAETAGAGGAVLGVPVWPTAAAAAGAALLRAALLGLAFLALRELYWRLRRREGLGLGDVKLAAVAGAWLDWPFMPLAVEIAALAALAAYALGRLAGRRFDAAARLPFGLFFAPAIWLCWLIAAGFGRF